VSAHRQQTLRPLFSLATGNALFWAWPELLNWLDCEAPRQWVFAVCLCGLLMNGVPVMNGVAYAIYAGSSMDPAALV